MPTPPRRSPHYSLDAFLSVRTGVSGRPVTIRPGRSARARYSRPARYTVPSTPAGRPGLPAERHTGHTVIAGRSGGSRPASLSRRSGGARLSRCAVRTVRTVPPALSRRSGVVHTGAAARSAVTGESGTTIPPGATRHAVRSSITGTAGPAFGTRRTVRTEVSRLALDAHSAGAAARAGRTGEARARSTGRPVHTGEAIRTPASRQETGEARLT